MLCSGFVFVYGFVFVGWLCLGSICVRGLFVFGVYLFDGFGLLCSGLGLLCYGFVFWVVSLWVQGLGLGIRVLP